MFYDNDEWDDYDREPDAYAKGSAYCSDCGRKFRTEELIVMKDHRYCRECFEDRFPGVDPENPDSYEECACCEEYFHKDEMEKASGGWVCRSCLTKCFSMCDSCCEYYLKENMTELGDARLCDKCLSEQFGRCDVCREYCEKDKLVTLTDKVYCPECYAKERSEDSLRMNPAGTEETYSGPEETDRHTGGSVASGVPENREGTGAGKSGRKKEMKQSPDDLVNDLVRERFRQQIGEKKAELDRLNAQRETVLKEIELLNEMLGSI